MPEALRFAFSIRSPYAWIAAKRILPEVDSVRPVEWLPFFPLPEFENFGNLLPTKVRYIIEDLIRLTDAYDLPLGRPPPRSRIGRFPTPPSCTQTGSGAGQPWPAD